MLRRLRSTMDLMRPRTFARMAKGVDDLLVTVRDLRRLLKQLEETQHKTAERVAAVEHKIVDLSQGLADVTLHSSQLRAVYQRDVGMESELPALEGLLDLESVSGHVAKAVAAATLEHVPFPHIVVEPLLPEPLYDAVIRGLPPLELFGDRPANKQRLVVPLDFAPQYSRRVWNFLVEQVVERAIAPALAAKFRQPLADWIGSHWPALTEGDDPSVRLQSSDGRILLRRRGYLITPHRDPKWGFLTCLMYLARPRDSESWGTQLFEVADDSEAKGGAPHWIPAEQCRLVKSVPFRRNTALAFLNSTGAHGASIPADAEPPDLERYIYQFRIGPTPDAVKKLMASLPRERREFWTGKAAADYT